MVVALAAALLVSSALPAGADPEVNSNNNNSATEIELDCGITVLVMFATSSAIAFEPGVDNSGREYAMKSIVGEGVLFDGTLLYDYAHEWGLRKGYRGAEHECSGEVTYPTELGDVTESFTLTLQGKDA